MKGVVFASVNWDKLQNEFREELKNEYELPSAEMGAFYMNKTYANIYGREGEFHENDSINIKLKYLPAIIARPDIDYDSAFKLTREITSQILEKINKKQSTYFLKEAEIIGKINKNPKPYVDVCKKTFGTIYLTNPKE